MLGKFQRLLCSISFLYIGWEYPNSENLGSRAIRYWKDLRQIMVKLLSMCKSNCSRRTQISTSTFDLGSSSTFVGPMFCFPLHQTMPKNWSLKSIPTSNGKRNSLVSLFFFFLVLSIRTIYTQWRSCILYVKGDPSDPYDTGRKGNGGVQHAKWIHRLKTICYHVHHHWMCMHGMCAQHPHVHAHGAYMPLRAITLLSFFFLTLQICSKFHVLVI